MPDSSTEASSARSAARGGSDDGRVWIEGTDISKIIRIGSSARFSNDTNGTQRIRASGFTVSLYPWCTVEIRRTRTLRGSKYETVGPASPMLSTDIPQDDEAKATTPTTPDGLGAQLLGWDWDTYPDGPSDPQA